MITACPWLTSVWTGEAGRQALALAREVRDVEVIGITLQVGLLLAFELAPRDDPAIKALMQANGEEDESAVSPLRVLNFLFALATRQEKAASIAEEVHKSAITVRSCQIQRPRS